MALFNCAQDIYKPVILNGHKIKRIYTFDAMQNSGTLIDKMNGEYLHYNSYSSALIGAVAPMACVFNAYPTNNKRYLTLSGTLSWGSYKGFNTKIGYIYLNTETNSAGTAITTYLTVYSDSTKQTTLFAKTSIYAAADATTYYHLLKMNDTCYLLMTFQSLAATSNYDLRLSAVTVNTLTLKNGAVVRGSFGIGGGTNQTVADSSAYYNRRNSYLASMNEENTQFIAFQKIYQASSSADTAYYWYTNCGRWRATTVVGLRTTAWLQPVTTVNFVGSSIIRFYEGLGVDLYIKNYKTSAVSYNAYFSRQGDLYSAQPINGGGTGYIAPDSCEYLTKENAPFRMYGIVSGTSGVEGYVYIEASSIPSYQDGYIHATIMRYGEINKLRAVPINVFDTTTSSGILINDKAWKSLIVAQGYLYPSFAFMKEGLLIIGMRKETYNSYSRGSSTYEENIRCMVYAVEVDTVNKTISFKFSGVCEGGTFRNENLLNLTLPTTSSNAYAEYFDANPDKYDYDAFRSWVLEYEPSNTYVVY